ncbi:MAG: uroporphyrinogen-III synthase, partial [Candidatus Methanomethyliaceae archaeon]|nr:uroporphyrinogen-III synthase [Candidatus Methanomethyliaceae archaeon]
MVQGANDLRGRTIVIMRALNQAEETVELIKSMGGKPYLLPMIKLKPLKPISKIKSFINDLESGKIFSIIFMSVNSVKYFYKIIDEMNIEVNFKVREAMKNTILIAVGPKTAKALEEFNVIIPREFSSNGLIEYLKDMDLKNKIIYIFRSKDANSILRENLIKYNAIVKEIYLYKILLPSKFHFKEKFLKDLNDGRINAIIFGSFKNVKHFFQIFPELKSLINRLTIVAIGPITANTLMNYGVKADVIPRDYTFEGA